jgi:hypothetical protein
MYTKFSANYVGQHTKYARIVDDGLPRAQGSIDVSTATQHSDSNARRNLARHNIGWSVGGL